LSLEPSKTTVFRLLGGVAVIGIVLAGATCAQGQVSKINSVVIQPRVVNSANLSNAVLTVVTNYPSIVSFTETNAGTTNTAFSALQDVWQFSADGGNTPYLFQTNDYYTAFMNVTLTGNPVSPRKEAGIAFNDQNGAISGQYILDTDAGEVVAFGGNLPFYATALNHQFHSGDTITMGVTITKDTNGVTSIIYSADGISSPPLEFNQGAVYLANNNTTPAPYTLGGYFQIQGQNTPATNNGSAVFQNITIFSQPSLNIAKNGNTSIIYWPASEGTFVLQSSTNLTSTNWTDVNSNSAFISGVVVTNSGTNKFYRLVAP